MKSDFWKPWNYEEYYSPYQTKPINILPDTSKIEEDPVQYNININIKDENLGNNHHRFDSPKNENKLLEQIYENSLKLSQNLEKFDLRAHKEKSFPIAEKEKDLSNIKKKPPKFNKKNNAAITIQKNWKAFLTRQKYLEFRKRWIIFRFRNTFQTSKKSYIKKNASKILLKHFKDFSLRLQLRKKLLLEKFQSHCALLIQRNYRLFRLRRKIASKPPLCISSIHREFTECSMNADNLTTIKNEKREEDHIKNEQAPKIEKQEKQENDYFEPKKKPPFDSTNKWEERENMTVGGANKKKVRTENFSPSDLGNSPFASRKKEASPKKERSLTPKPFLKKGQRNVNVRKTPIKERDRKEGEMEEEKPLSEENNKKVTKKNNSEKKLLPKVSKSPKRIGRKEVEADDKRDFLKKKSNSLKNGEKINVDGIGVKVDCWLHKPTSHSQSRNDERNLNNNINNTIISQNNNNVNPNFLNNQNNSNLNKGGLVQQRVSYWQLDAEQDRSLRFIKNITNIDKNDDGALLVGSGPKFTESSHDGGEGVGVEDLERAYRTNYFSKMASKYYLIYIFL